MRVNDRVRHIKKDMIGTVCEIRGDRVFVNWSDETGIMFRWAKKQDLEVI